MGKKLRLIGVSLLMAVAVGWTAVRAQKPAGEDAVFKMDEVSAFEGQVGGPSAPRLIGPMFMCTTTPTREVKAYPKLNSKQPLYGTVTFPGGGSGPANLVRYCFVLDESEPAAPPAGAQKAEEKAATPGATPKAEAPKGDSKSPTPKPGTLVERSRLGLPGTVPETKHDLLYFDANGDLDLTNDPPIQLMKDPPKGPLTGTNFKVFDTLSLEIPLAPDPGTAKFRILPVLQAFGGNMSRLRFMPATVRKGKIRLGNQEYTAILSYQDPITGRLDDPQTGLQLIPAGEEATVPRMGTSLEWLSAMRDVGGVLYQFSATPSGDELRAAPYRGDFGVFEVAPANKDVKESGAVGIFVGKDRTAMFGAPVITMIPTPEAKVPRHELPVGDYAAFYLALRVGKVGITLRQNSYYEPGAASWRTHEPVVHITKDKPVVLDFVQKPKVVFTTPAADTSVRTGSVVMIRAVMIEPTLHLRVMGMEDRTRKTGEMTTMGPDGKPITETTYAPLDPDIVILDSSGKEVAKGKMPFG